ncbi:MAG: hypothetical protein CML66_17445 [Rhodobacteraceae bacterium]|nr:hypothetical protein [Paracoccaceae bacterium]|tara:strand:+ start:474 stop:821 length:348 start_codon:yes stop_codon:yes gene_type:complete
MSDDFKGFDARLRRIDRNHRAMAHGYQIHMQRDGLIVARPRRARSLPVSPRSVVLFVVAFLAFKAVLIASLGTLSYTERVGALAGGSWFEKGGAWIMRIDPISRKAATYLAPYLK